MQSHFGNHASLSCPRYSCRWPSGGWRQTPHYWSLMDCDHILAQFGLQNEIQKLESRLTVSADSLHCRCFGNSHDGLPRIILLRHTLSKAPEGEEGPYCPEHNDPAPNLALQTILWMNSPESGCARSRWDLINLRRSEMGSCCFRLLFQGDSRWSDMS